MKAIKLIIIFIVQLGGVLGALYLLTNGEKDDPASSSDTNVIADTTAIGDTAIIEDATDEDNRITDPLGEEEVMAPTQETRPKQKAGVNPSESKQSENEVSEKEKPKPSEHKTKTKHKYTCKTCGPNTWFYSQKEFDTHCAFYHGEE